MLFRSVSRCVFLLAFALGAAVGQIAIAPPASTDPNWLLTTGIGYKPYQTTIKAGSSAFIEGGKQVTPGLYGFVRLDARSTDAQMIFEGCKTLFSTENLLPMVCGGPGFGADANNIGLSLAGGGKLFYRVTKVRNFKVGDNTWLYFSVTVDKNVVPAPVTPNPTPANPGGVLVISAVQPNFRIGISKTF